MSVICGLSLGVSWISCLLISSVICLPAPKDNGLPGLSNPAPSGLMHWSSTSGSGDPNAGRLYGGASLSRTSRSLSQGPAAQNSNNKPGSPGLGGSFSSPQATGSINRDAMSNAGVPRYWGGGYSAPTGAYGGLASTGNARYGGYNNAGVGTGLGSLGLGVTSSTKPRYWGGGYSAPTGAYGGQASTGNDAGYGNGGYSNTGVGTGLYYTNSGSTDGAGGYTQFHAEGAVEESPEPVFSVLSDLEPVSTYRSRSRYQHGSSQFSKTRYTPGEVQFSSMPVAVSGPENPVHVTSKGGF